MSSSRKIVLKKLPEYNTVWHPESTVVFKSQKERLVIGRIVDKKLVSLDQECLEICDEWSFKPDETLLCEESDVEVDTEGDTEGDTEINREKVSEEEKHTEQVLGKEDENEEETEQVPEEEEEDENEDENEEETEQVPEEETEEETEQVPEDEISETKEYQQKDTTIELDSQNSEIETLRQLTDKLLNGVSPMIIALQNKVSKLSDENSCLTRKLSEKTNDMVELQEKYDIIDKKFKAMKSLFN